MEKVFFGCIALSLTYTVGCRVHTYKIGFWCAFGLSKIMFKYENADTLIDRVLTIRCRKSKEFLLLTCYDLTKLS